MYLNLNVTFDHSMKQVFFVVDNNCTLKCDRLLDFRKIGKYGIHIFDLK